MELTSTDKLMLSCVKIHLNATDTDYLNSLVPLVDDWEYALKTMIDRGIAPLFYNKLSLLSNRNLVPAAAQTKLQQAYFRTLSRGMILSGFYAKLAEIFYQNNIKFIPLKGIYLSGWLYQDIGLRQFSDIDLLVKKEDAEKCIQIMSKMGYTSFESHETEIVGAQTEIIHYAPMILKEISVEIHIKLHSSKEKYHLDPDEIWQNSVPAEMKGVSVSTLNINDLLIYLCLHLDKHFRGGHVQFTSFNDLVNLLDKYAGEIDWELFVGLTRKYNCEEIVFGYFMLIQKYFNVRLPEPLTADHKGLLIESDEELFLKYLNGFTGFNTTVGTHFGNMQRLDNFWDKTRYFAGIIFPKKMFMIQKYKIKNPRMVLLYYPYRYYIGIKGIIVVLKNRLRQFFISPVHRRLK